MPAMLRARGELTLAQIAALTNSQLIGEQNCRRIGNFAALDMAESGDIGYVDDDKDLSQVRETRAGACFVAPRFAAAVPAGVAVLINEHPYRAFVAAARALFPDALEPSSLFDTTGLAPGAQVHGTARIEAGVTIDPLALIGPRAQIGGGALIAAGAMLGPEVCIGRRCVIGAGASIMHALIGDRVIVSPGARIGQDSLCGRPDANGTGTLPSIRRVILQDETEIGANATIDRGAIRDTVIGEGAKIDSLVQIAPDVHIGRYCMIGAQSTIAAGASIGDFAVIGAQVAIAGHIAVGEGARLSGRSMIDSEVPPRAPRFAG